MLIKELRIRRNQAGKLGRGLRWATLLEDAIVQMPHTVRKVLGRKQFERNGSLLRFNQRYAFADEDRNDMEAEFVDLSFVQKRSDDLAPSHHPNVLTGLRPQALREWLYRLENREKWGTRSLF